jgi:hypothetical protein
MTIIYSDDSGQIIWPTTDCHDISSKKYYTINYRPEDVQRTKEYIKGVGLVVPTVSNGCMYECVSGGLTSGIEPTWGTVEGKITEDGSVSWKCKPLNCRLQYGDTITTSTWTTSDGVTTDNPTILNNTTTLVRVTGVVTTSKTFTITNHITVLRASGRTEEFDKSIVITLKVL